MCDSFPSTAAALIRCRSRHRPAAGSSRSGRFRLSVDRAVRASSARTRRRGRSRRCGRRRCGRTAYAERARAPASWARCSSCTGRATFLNTLSAENTGPFLEQQVAAVAPSRGRCSRRRRVGARRFGSFPSPAAAAEHLAQQRRLATARYPDNAKRCSFSIIRLSSRCTTLPPSVVLTSATSITGVIARARRR